MPCVVWFIDMFYIQLQITCRDWINGMNMYVCIKFLPRVVSVEMAPRCTNTVSLQIFWAQYHVYPKLILGLA